MDKKLKVCVITLGCKVNQYESNGMAKALEENGFLVSFKLEPADIFILNTCAVTNESEKKSRGHIAKIKKLSPDAKIYICGCAAQNNPAQFERFENVRVILGNFNKTQLVNHVIENEVNGGFKQTYINNEQSLVYDDFKFTKGERTRTVIKIQEGCNNFCSYCLIPYIRGRERSRDFESVKAEIEFHRNTKEIVFTGINLSNYGIDLKEKKSLKDVAILMRNYPEIRFRFSSLEQNVIDEEFMQILAKTPNFAPHFHLSLQSGCDKTLKDMNRKYLTEQYYSKIELIKKYFSHPAITTDIIVGFPTETEEDFDKTYEFAKKCGFSKIHIFPYSLRTGTLATRFKNIATNVKERVEKLTNLSKIMQEQFLSDCKNIVFSVIVEREKDGYYEGYTENYIKCYIKSDSFLAHNQIVKIMIDKPYKDGVIAKLLLT